MFKGLVKGYISNIHQEVTSYVDLKTKTHHRYGRVIIDGGITIDIVMKECDYQKYTEKIALNNWGNEHKFAIWGSLRSLNELTENTGLSPLYMKADIIEPCEKDSIANFFSITAHTTKTVEEDGEHKYFRIAANKAILNKSEKLNKSITYCNLKTPLNRNYTNKDIIQGSGKLIFENEQLMLEEIYTKAYTVCRELTELYLPEKLSEDNSKEYNSISIQNNKSSTDVQHLENVI